MAFTAIPDVASRFRIISYYLSSFCSLHRSLRRCHCRSTCLNTSELNDFLVCHLMANTNGFVNKRYIKSLYFKLFQWFTFYCIRWEVNKNSRLDRFDTYFFLSDCFFLLVRSVSWPWFSVGGEAFDKSSYDTMFEWEAINLSVWHLLMDKILDLSLSYAVNVAKHIVHPKTKSNTK